MGFILELYLGFTAWKLSKYEVFSGPYFPVFSLNTGMLGSEKTPYLDTFHAVFLIAVKNKKIISEKVKF